MLCQEKNKREENILNYDLYRCKDITPIGINSDYTTVKRFYNSGKPKTK